MPVYEYECKTCGGRFEVVRKFSDPLLTECQLCKAPDIRKLLSPAAFVLKGSGWYATDYASCDRKKAEASDAPAAASASGGQGCSSGTCASGTCPAKG